MNEYSVGIEILKILHEKGFDAYFVGGFVRDHILGITSNDIDITSNATPEDVMSIFECIPQGIKYGTVLIDYKGYKFEHTTFRSDGKYQDTRHPNDVTYAKDVKEDLVRRDFTINSLLIGYDEKVYDYLNGIDDLNKHIIKCIGNPDNRFKEDALRILRAFSFISKLGFDLDIEAEESIKRNMHLLANISIERIRIEFEKISNGKYREKAWKKFYELRINECFPNMSRVLTNYNLSFMQILVLNVEENAQISDFWQLSKDKLKTIQKAYNLLKTNMTDYDLFNYGYNASNLAYMINHNDFVDRWNSLKIKSIKDLDITGYDLINVVKKESRANALLYLSKQVLENKIENKKSVLLEEVKKWSL